MSGKVLIIDSSEFHRVTLRAQLESAYFAVFCAIRADKAIAAALKHRPDVILLNVDLQDGDGVALCARIKAHPYLATTPVVLMAESGSADQRILGFEAGADDFLSKPVNAVALFARMRSLARFRLMTEELKLRDATSLEFGLEQLTPAIGDEAQCRLGVISRDRAKADRIGAEITKRLGVACFWVADGLTALRLTRSAPPDGFLICPDLPDGEDGFALCSALTYHRDGAAPAVVMMTARDDAGDAARCLDHGAGDYVAAPADMNELAARLRSQLRRKLYAEKLGAFVRDGLRLSVTDPLTGLYNRRYVDQHLSRRFAAARRQDEPLTVLVFDIDKFKRVNDRFGHTIGDQALRVFSERLRANLRGVDLIARIGGEEFLVALPGVSLAQGSAAAERMRRLAAIPMPGAPRITVSVGVAAITPADNDASDLIKRADRALYLAKTGGRNCVVRDAAA